MSARGRPVSSREILLAYLELVGSPKAIQERAESLLAVYESLGVQPSGFFLSEYRQEDGSPVHQSLWLFTDDLAMEAKLPTTGGEQFDFVPLARAIRHLVVEATDYDFAKASDESRMRVEVWFDGQRLGELRASASNCDLLMTVVGRYLLPNVAPLATDR
jgi:hypothetical protein